VGEKEILVGGIKSGLSATLSIGLLAVSAVGVAAQSDDAPLKVT
jgi:hypothetical protein